MYNLILSPEFLKELKGLDTPLKERVLRILDRLKDNLFGEALQGDLKGYYCVHFEHNRYRLVYRNEDGKLDILAIHVGKRTDSFYVELKRRIKTYLNASLTLNTTR